MARTAPLGGTEREREREKERVAAERVYREKRTTHRGAAARRDTYPPPTDHAGREGDETDEDAALFLGRGHRAKWFVPQQALQVAELADAVGTTTSTVSHN